MINSRLFGSDLNIGTKKKLELRQKLAEGPQNPTDEVQSDYPDMEFDPQGKGHGKYNYTYNDLTNFSFNEGIFDLSSRTPFVRMWTAVEVNAKMGESFEFIYDPRDYYVEGESITEEEKDALAKQAAERQAQNFKGSKIVKANDVYVIVDAEVKEQADIKMATKIYSLGNNVFNQLTQTTDAGTNLGARYESGYARGSNLGGSGVFLGDIIREEMSDDNSGRGGFLEPPAGITGLSSTTEGTMGVIKKTNVKFLVHNWHDYDKIYLKYFLRPGAQIFVDFGWSTSDLYDPKDMLSETNMEEFLWGEKSKNDKKDGHITSTYGDMETLVGIVTNYNSKVLENGSVECSVEITSKNSALLNETTRQSTFSKMKHILESLIMFEGVVPTLSDNEKQYLEQIVDQSTAVHTDVNNNLFYSTKNLADFGQTLHDIADKRLSSNNLTPTEVHKELGVIVTEGVTHKFVSWGKFEDDVVNSQFGFGANLDEINNKVKNKKYFQVSMNSKNCYVTFDQNFVNRQSDLAREGRAPVCVVPDNWDYTYNTKNDQIPMRDKDILDTLDGSYTSYDTRGAIKKIPLRDVFIRTDVILEAFENTNNFKDAMGELLDVINEDSADIWDLKLFSGADDNTVSVIDSGLTDVESKIRAEGGNTFFDNLFEFNVMSPNSIVKGYNLSFDFPSGKIGSMYAIQGMSSTDRLTPITEALDEALSLDALERLDDYFITYKPYIGNHKVETLNAESAANAELLQHYGKVLDKYKKETRMQVGSPDVGLRAMHNANTGRTPEDRARTNVDKGSSSEEVEETISINKAVAELLGISVVSDSEEYWKQKINGERVVNTKPTLLPLKLSLTIYGIGNIAPGDCFRVDWLPEKYKNNVYFQTMRVNHDVVEDGWYTTIETQFRIRTSGNPTRAAGKGPKQRSENYVSKKKSHVSFDVNGLGIDTSSPRLNIHDDVGLEDIKTGISNQSAGVQNPYHTGADSQITKMEKWGDFYQHVYPYIGFAEKDTQLADDHEYFNHVIHFTANVQKVISENRTDEKTRVYFPVSVSTMQYTLGNLATQSPRSGRHKIPTAIEQGFGYLQAMGAYWQNNGFPDDPGSMPAGLCRDNTKNKGWEKDPEELVPPFDYGCGIQLEHGKQYTLITHTQDPTYYFVIIEKPTENSGDPDKYMEALRQLNVPLYWRWWGPWPPEANFGEITDDGVWMSSDYNVKNVKEKYAQKALTGQTVENSDVSWPMDTYFGAVTSTGNTKVVRPINLYTPTIETMQFGNVAISREDLELCNSCHLMMNSGNFTRPKETSGGYDYLFDDQHYRYAGANYWIDFGPWYCQKESDGGPGYTEQELKDMCETDGFMYPFWSPDDWLTVETGADYYTEVPDDVRNAYMDTYPDGQKHIQTNGRCKWIPATKSRHIGIGNDPEEYPLSSDSCGRCVPNYNQKPYGIYRGTFDDRWDGDPETLEFMSDQTVDNIWDQSMPGPTASQGAFEPYAVSPYEFNGCPSLIGGLNGDFASGDDSYVYQWKLFAGESVWD